MRKLKFLSVILAVSLLWGCNSSKRITYFQDTANEAVVALAGNGQIKIKPHDRLTVVVSSKDSELAAPFNATTSYSSLSQSPMGQTSVSGAQSLQVRTVNEKGMLYIPIIGDIYCVGKTRAELADEIATKIKQGGYISDAVVNIQFADMKFYVLGEVARPGQFDITRDKITILEALSMAGDMTIYGNRTNVSVIRKDVNSDKNTIYQLNLLTSEAMTSPAYYLEQGDVVYVQPNRYKAATSEINQNRTFWISIASTLLTAASLVISIVTLTNYNKLGGN
jgi:polysaccharide export outer membrane protein